MPQFFACSSPIPTPLPPPCPQAIFNFVIAWAVMFVPVILSDDASRKIPNKAAWCTAIAFTTNIAFTPYLALRAAPEPPAAAAAGQTATAGQTSAGAGLTAVKRPAPGGTQAVGPLGRVTGALGLAMCGFCVAWAFLGRPEMAGGLTERAAYLQSEFGSNRVGVVWRGPG